jgi:hypothetical protein
VPVDVGVLGGVSRGMHTHHADKFKPVCAIVHLGVLSIIRNMINARWDNAKSKQSMWIAVAFIIIAQLYEMWHFNYLPYPVIEKSVNFYIYELSQHYSASLADRTLGQIFNDQILGAQTLRERSKCAQVCKIVSIRCALTLTLNKVSQGDQWKISASRVKLITNILLIQ